MKVNLDFISVEKAERAKKIYDMAEKNKPFGLKLKDRKVLFRPDILQALDFPSMSMRKFNTLEDMMVEASGLLFVATDVFIPKEKDLITLDNENKTIKRP